MGTKEAASAKIAQAIGTSVWSLIERVRGVEAARDGASAAPGPTATQGVGEPSTPPASNTGGKLTASAVEGLKVGLDWLSFVGSSARIQELKACNVDRWGDPEAVERGGCSYQRQLRYQCGAVLFYSDGRDDCMLSCPGAALASIDPLEQLRLLRQLHGLGYHTSRVDARVDDYARAVELDQVHAAAEAGDFTSFRLTEAKQPKRLTADGLQKTGDSRTFGRRGANGSGVYYRVYDKQLESRGEVDCVRWEVEFSGPRARVAGRMLADCEDVGQLVKLCGELVGGHIDFRERLNETHVDRRRRLGWWQTFLERIGRAVIAVDRVKAPLQAALAAMSRQYKSTLGQALIECQRTGVDFFSLLRELVLVGASEVDPRRLASRDSSLNVTAAFRLPSRGRVFVPLSASRSWVESIPF